MNQIQFTDPNNVSCVPVAVSVPAGVVTGNGVVDLTLAAVTETATAAGALSTTTLFSKLAVPSGGAVTLAAPSSAIAGQFKTIQMTTDDGDVTLALTNVVGQSSGTTATFDTAGDALVLQALANSKWVVIKEYGITLT